MQNNTNLSNCAQTTVPHTAEDAYVKCSAMTNEDFGKQLGKYNKNKHDRIVGDLVALENNPNFKIEYYSINLSEYPNPISVCFVARVYDNRNGSWTNYIFCDSDEINKILYSFGNNDFIKKAIKDEINRLSYFGAKEINFYNLDVIKGIEFLYSDKLG